MNSGLKIISVRGEIEISAVGICDAHSHLWINPVENLNPDAPVLNQLDAIKEELVDYKNSGGTSIIDCQPGGCGRDGNQLRLLSDYSSVNVIASTGFHLQRYYPADYWLFNAGVDKAAELFIQELEYSLTESNKVNQLVYLKLLF